MTAASDPDILAGVERWARVRGLWRGSEFDARNCASAGLHIVGPVPGDMSFYIMASDPPAAVQVHRASPAIALAWALLVETDAGPVDVGWCPVCKGAGSIPGERPSWANPHGEPPEPCGCYGGRDAIPAARLLLDAANGDAAARAALYVHADHRQAIGDPRGDLLALALGPWSGEPTRSDWFYASTEETSALMVADGWTRGPAKVPGVRLTHVGRRVAAWPFSRPVLPGTADALRWLEWLTWAREFAAEHHADPRAGFMRRSAGAPQQALDYAWSALGIFCSRWGASLAEDWALECMPERLGDGLVRFRFASRDLHEITLRAFVDDGRVMAVVDGTVDRHIPAG
jgi:hypothetical protein